MKQVPRIFIILSEVLPINCYEHSDATSYGVHEVDGRDFGARDTLTYDKK